MSQPYQTIDVVRSIAPHLFDHSRRTYRRRTTKMAVPASVPLQTGPMARELESMSPKARQHYAECAQQRAKLDKFYRGPREEEIRLYEARKCKTEEIRDAGEGDENESHEGQLQVREWPRDGV